MNPGISLVKLSDLVAMATLFSGLTLALLLGFAKRAGKIANLYLSLAIAVIVLKTAGVTLVFLPALGPLLYFYTRQLTGPDRRFHRKDLLHFCPLLVGFWMPPWLILVTVIIYLFLSHRLIEGFYRRLRLVLMDRPRYAFRRLDSALLLLGICCVLTVFSDTFYLAAAFVLIGLAVEVILKPDSNLQLTMPISDRATMKEKGRRLKEAVAANRLYEDAELTLATLAEKLKIHPHDLSRIINTGLEKNFNDFVNEFRVREIARKILDPAFDRLTVLGIAYDSGFNSKTTFNRVFKEMTGKTPTEYKNSSKNDVPIHKMALRSQIRPVILRSALQNWGYEKLNSKYMLRNYVKIAWRNLIKSKVYSGINVLGLAAGMAVAMLIGLWIWDELTYDHYHKNHDKLAQVMTTLVRNGGELNTNPFVASPLGNELRTKYGSDFKNVSMASSNQSRVLTVGDKKISAQGMWVEANFPSMLTLKMLKGNINGLNDPSSVLLSASVAKSFFGDADPLNKVVRIDNQDNYKVAGVYEDLPHNTTLNEAKIFLSWDKYVKMVDWVKESMKHWNNKSFHCYVQLNDNVDFNKETAKIKLASMAHLNAASDGKEELVLQPMNNWRLYSEFKNGKATGGRIQFLNLFAIIGIFVLLIACINFMNLSTARSEKRSKEVGIRKTVGSLKSQLITQFLSEAILIAGISFLFCLLFAQLLLPLFNTLSGKQMTLPFNNVFFWIVCVGFAIITGLLAGSYPAFYLSRFEPIKVLKGTYRVGRFASLPRKVLVVLQFSVSITLVIGTIIVYKQIQFAKNRPVGYNRESLIAVYMTTPDLFGHYDAMRSDLLATNVVENMAESSSPVTSVWSSQIGYSWEGKDPAMQSSFGTIGVTQDYGKTINWQITEGRDFSTDFSDSNSIILNEAAVKLTGIKNIVGKIIRKEDRNLTVVGVIKDMVMESPYAPVTPTIFLVTPGWVNVIYIRMKTGTPLQDALAKIATVFEKYNPSAPFDYKFIDEEYAQKFSDEQRIGNLASFFAALAIFISCLGLFGLASFVAEQRTKEISVRKVLGASVFSLWQMLSKDFVLMVLISSLIAVPFAWYFLNEWLQQYNYRTTISLWIFFITCIGALIVTLITVSFQAIKAAIANPVKSLRTE